MQWLDLSNHPAVPVSICSNRQFKRYGSARSSVGRRGAVAVEAALVVPLLLLVTFAVMEFGYYYYLRHNFMSAAQYGARTWVRAGTAAASDVDDAVASILSPLGLTSTQYTITYTVNGAEAPVNTAVKGDIIAIELEADWGGASGIGLRPMGVIDASKKVNAVAIMQKE